MKLHLNLRGDLAKLTDQELGDRLEQSWQAYKAAEALTSRGWFQITWFDLWRWRGPLRHPRAYKFFSALDLTGAEGWPGMLFTIAFSTKYFDEFRAAAQGPQSEMYLHACEMRDIVDEAERRIAQRQGQTP
jgi:hypothetical protein